MAAFMLFPGIRRSRRRDSVEATPAASATNTSSHAPESRPTPRPPHAPVTPGSAAWGRSTLRRSRRYRSDGVLGLRWLA